MTTTLVPIIISLNLEVVNVLADCQILTPTDKMLPTCVKSLADVTPCNYSTADILSLFTLKGFCDPASLTIDFDEFSSIQD